MKKRRELTEEQKAKAAERKAKLRDMHSNQGNGRRRTGATGESDATIVGGFRQWLREGRAVRKGEHGLGILIPRFEKGEGGDGPGSLNGFLYGTVFDVSQTDATAVI